MHNYNLLAENGSDVPQNPMDRYGVQTVSMQQLSVRKIRLIAPSPLRTSTAFSN